jgi:hypothetical protein
MGDDERGPPFHQQLHRVDDGRFSLGVERAGRLVQDEDRRIFQERTGERDALTFASRKEHATLSHSRLIAVGKPADEVMCMGMARGRDDLVIGGPGTRVCDVLGDAA